jgi:hypothetical protein
MSYILVIWTTVAAAGGGGHGGFHRIEYGWRPIGEFHHQDGRNVGESKKTPLQMCEAAARELGLKPENYRCLRSR